MRFRWNEHSLDHATKHGCTAAEIESVVRRGGRGFPRKIGNGKYLVMGRGQGGRLIQVIYVIDRSGAFYVIHAMPLRRQ